jgi:hypothetical protein
MERVRPIATPQRWWAIAAMAVGLVLTIVATIVPFLTSDLRDHIEASYPHYRDARVDDAVTAWLIILTVVGALGVIGWLWTIWVVQVGKRWATWAATAMLVLGTCVALSLLLIKDTSGDTGLASTLGWLELLPCLAGLVAVALLWSGRREPAR